MISSFSKACAAAWSCPNENQAGHFFLFALHAAVAAFQHFAHAGEIVVTPFSANDELAVIGFTHAPVFPDHHGGDGVGALKMGNIKALDASGRSGKVQSGLQSLGNGF